MNDLNSELTLEVLEARLEMEVASMAAPWLPIECWCN